MYICNNCKKEHKYVPVRCHRCDLDYSNSNFTDTANLNINTFLEPDNMKILGFDCIKNESPYYIYHNDGTKHNNKDYNKDFPEPKGKIIIQVNIKCYGENRDIPAIGIKQDGGTRSVYNGQCPTENFLIELIKNIR